MVSESFDAVDEYDGNVPTVAAREVWIEVYVDLSERVLFFTEGGAHGLSGLVAEVAAGSRVERHAGCSRVGGIRRLVHFVTLPCLARRKVNAKKYILPQCREKGIKCEHAGAIYHNFICAAALLSNA